MNSLMYFIKQIHAYSGKVVYINLFAMACIGLLEGFAILLLIPLITMTGLIDFGGNKIAVLQIFNPLESIPTAIGLPIVLSIYVIIVVSQNMLNRQLRVQNTKLQQGFLRHMRVETYHSLLHANWDFFIKHRKSDLINILTAEIGRSSMGAYSVLQFIASLAFTFIQVGLAFVLSPGITSFVLLFGLVLLIFNRKFLKKSIALGKINYELGREYMSGITDQMNGIKDIKSNTLEISRLRWFNSVAKKIEDEQVEYTRLKSTSQLYYKIASAILIAIFIYVALMMFDAQIAQLLLVIAIFSRLWPRVVGIQSTLEQIATTIPAFHAVKAIQKECKKAREFKSQEKDVKRIKIRNKIECDHISFRYNLDKPKYALKEVNITIPANQMTAIVGPSGAGKSTLIDIIMGLNQSEDGAVYIDGNPLTEDKLLPLRKAISYVPQDPFLFNTTIRENLQIVYTEATEDDMWQALEFASAAEFVRDLPNQLDTVIGDRGIKLSGGERQRVVLARAILREPSILVLDEATSSLDTENEANIQGAIEQLKGRMTIIVIAHRLSTIRHADQVIVLNEGRVVQKGKYSQLSREKRNIFHRLLQNQVEATSL